MSKRIATKKRKRRTTTKTFALSAPFRGHFLAFNPAPSSLRNLPRKPPQSEIPRRPAVCQTGSAAKKRKRRKKGNEEAKDGTGTTGFLSLAQGVFADFKFPRAKIHQEAVLDPRRPQVAEHLGHMFVSESLGRLQLNDQAIVHQHIGVIIANQGAVFVIDLERVLLLDLQADFPQAMHQGVFIRNASVTDGRAGSPLPAA